MKKILLIAYEGKVKGDEEPFERIEEGKPLVVILGAGDIIPGLEEEIRKMEVGEEREVELPPERAFGPRKQELIVIIPEREFRKRGITPYPGLSIEADGRTGRVLSVSAGRVQVDFNHPLAGKTLVYRVKLIKEISDVEEGIRHLFRRFFSYEPEEVTYQDGTLRISYLFSREAERVEPAFVAYVLTNFEEVKEVRMEKIYRRRREEQPKAPSGGHTSP